MLRLGPLVLPLQQANQLGLLLAPGIGHRLLDDAGHAQDDVVPAALGQHALARVVVLDGGGSAVGGSAPAAALLLVGGWGGGVGEGVGGGAFAAFLALLGGFGGGFGRAADLLVVGVEGVLGADAGGRESEVSLGRGWKGEWCLQVLDGLPGHVGGVVVAQPLDLVQRAAVLGEVVLQDLLHAVLVLIVIVAILVLVLVLLLVVGGLVGFGLAGGDLVGDVLAGGSLVVGDGR